jgi:diguanylate cyclase (GGDEF)-like protein/PAS domain S-box-containing protein
MGERIRWWASFIVGAIATGSAAVSFLAEAADTVRLSMPLRVAVAIAVGAFAAALTWALTGSAIRSRGALGRSAKALLRDSQLKLSEVIGLLPEATMVVDAEGTLVAWNQAMEELTGVPGHTVLGKDYRSFSLPFYGAPTRLLAQVLLDGARIPERFSEVRIRGSAVTGRVFAYMLGESGRHLAVTARVLVGTDGKVAGAIESIRDITKSVREEEAFRENDERLRAFFENAAVAAVVVSLTGEFAEFNHRWAAMLEYSSAELEQMRMSDVIHPDDLASAEEQVWRLASGVQDVARVEWRYVSRSGAVIWTDTSCSALRDSHGEVRSIIAIIVDTSERKRAEERLRDETRRDSLTCLANRRAFELRLIEEWRRAARSDTPLSLLMADVDRFKWYNDARGHLAGDECLVALAGLLRTHFKRATDFCARWGGEEFAVVLSDTDNESAMAAAERLRAAMEALGITRDDDGEGVVTISVGVATAHPARGGTADDLMFAADEGLYEAKRAGRNQVRTGAMPT